MAPRKLKPFGGSNTRAPPLPKPKNKPKHKQPDGDGASTSGGGRSKKSERSVWGFVCVAASVAVALWGWAVVQQAGRRRRHRAVLDGMLRRPLVFTEHAACRMDCRFVTQRQVHATLRHGLLNVQKSDPGLKPCPKYVVDAEVAAGGGRSKTVQGVFAACPHETRVLTVIDKDTNWPCGPC
jgi:hypothetical protein